MDVGSAQLLGCTCLVADSIKTKLQGYRRPSRKFPDFRPKRRSGGEQHQRHIIDHTEEDDPMHCLIALSTSMLLVI